MVTHTQGKKSEHDAQHGRHKTTHPNPCPTQHEPVTTHQWTRKHRHRQTCTAGEPRTLAGKPHARHLPATRKTPARRTARTRDDGTRDDDDGRPRQPATKDDGTRDSTRHENTRRRTHGTHGRTCQPSKHTEQGRRQTCAHLRRPQHETAGDHSVTFEPITPHLTI